MSHRTPIAEVPDRDTRRTHAQPRAAGWALWCSCWRSSPSLVVYLLIGVAIAESGRRVHFDNVDLGEALSFAALVVILAGRRPRGQHPRLQNGDRTTPADGLSREPAVLSGWGRCGSMGSEGYCPCTQVTIGLRSLI